MQRTFDWLKSKSVRIIVSDLPGIEAEPRGVNRAGIAGSLSSTEMPPLFPRYTGEWLHVQEKTFWRKIFIRQVALGR